MSISKYFTLAELTVSDTAKAKKIYNIPTGRTLQNLCFAAKKMDEVRELLGHPIIVSSGYRSPALNVEIGGSDTSAHTIGYAIDFTCPKFGDPYAVCKAIMASDIKYDQLIWEFNRWTHISFDPKLRMQELTAKAVKSGGKTRTTYIEGIK
jgi:putative chitinase